MFIFYIYGFSKFPNKPRHPAKGYKTVKFMILDHILFVCFFKLAKKLLLLH